MCLPKWWKSRTYILLWGCRHYVFCPTVDELVVEPYISMLWSGKLYIVGEGPVRELTVGQMTNGEKCQDVIGKLKVCSRADGWVGGCDLCVWVFLFYFSSLISREYGIFLFVLKISLSSFSRTLQFKAFLRDLRKFYYTLKSPNSDLKYYNCKLNMSKFRVLSKSNSLDTIAVKASFWGFCRA